MKTSAEVKNISEALLVAHRKIKHAIKDAKNPHFKNDYASLESVIDASKEHLLESGIVVIQGLLDKVLVTRLQHKSGEYMESSVELILTKNDMQAMGSAITYARRYSLAAMLNISQSDDDGEEASSGPATQTMAQKNVAGIREIQKEVAGERIAKKDDFASSDDGEHVMTRGTVNVKHRKISECSSSDLNGWLKFFDNAKAGAETKKEIALVRKWLGMNKQSDPPAMNTGEQLR